MATSAVTKRLRRDRGDGLIAAGGDGTFPVFGQYEDGELIRVSLDLVELEV